MATSTFDKEIIIDDKAADIIINVLNSPAQKKVIDNEILKRGDEVLSWLRLNSEKLSVPPKK